MDTSTIATSRNRHYSLTFLIKVTFTQIKLWHELSRSRRKLSELPDHLLEDVGLTKKQVETERSKSFWQ